MESIIDIDVSNYAYLLANDSFSEWQELLSQEVDEKIRVNEEGDVEQDWDAQESDLDGIVNIHSQLFGSVDLVKISGSIQVSDADRVSSFLSSYMLGMRMIQGLKGLSSSRFDAKIAPENLLRLCLEHDDKFILSQKLNRAYNFYKDPNSSMLAKLVEPITLLKQRILFLLKEWDDHSTHYLSLQKILEVVDMNLTLPLDTPLAKALSALEFLINRIRIVQETVAKFPLSDQLEPVFALVSSWHKLEFESWPTLLDEIQSQFEKNAGKLWFPLYSVFLRGHNVDVDEYKNSMIESLEEFFKTSTIGEFKKQLQLLLSFHGQMSNNLNWSNDLNGRSYTSPFQEENVKIIYNTFGFYLQLLPRILEHIGENRRSIEKELNELLKLCRWDRIENYFAIESFKRTRLKLRKIVKKYTDLLQQPLMEFLGHETSRKGISNYSVQGQKLMLDPYEVIRNLLQSICNRSESKTKESSTWFSDWTNRLERVHEVTSAVKDIIPVQSSCFYLEEKNQLWHTIEKLCVNIIHCGELWEDKTKSLGKRRAFSDLLKLLDSCGLSKHRTSVEGQFDRSHSWLHQPSYEVQHLLLTQSDDSSKNANVHFSHLQSSSHEIIWKTANKFYFKGIASIKYLEKICLNFHKDFSLIQVKRSASYVDHLIEIQQEQRVVAYNFANKLKCLRQCVSPLANFFSSFVISAEEPISDSSFCLNQHATFNCMWQQKQLFDGFCALLYEGHLLLQIVSNNHVNTCSIVKDDVEKIRLFFQKVLPCFQKPKNKLDHFLLGSNENISMAGIALHPYGVTKEMEELVNQNFKLIKSLQKDLSAFNGRGAVKHIMFGHFKDLFSKAIDAEESYASVQASIDVNGKEKINELESNFNVALKETYEHIIGVLQSIGSLNGDSARNEDSLMDMKEWKTLFQKDVEHLHLDLIHDDVMKMIQCVGELLNYHGERNTSISSVCVQLRQLYDQLDVILAFGDNLIQDFLDLHRMVSEVTYALANILALLFSQGFGSTEEKENDDTKEGTQDASGTGMGEGVGLNDVSDQINDEDQLLGTEKTNEELDDMSEMPSKTEKGIEMEEDFNAEACSVSEDSEDDENKDNEDEQIESAMGEVGTKSDVVDEKLGGVDDDDEDRKANEKYEQGPSVKDKASQEEEFRAKEDPTAAKEDTDDLDAKESGEQNEENGNEEGHDGEEDMKVDKDDAYVDPSGVYPDVENKSPEQETPMDEQGDTEPMEDGEMDDLDDSDAKNDEENATEFQEKGDSEHPTDDTDAANAEGDVLENNTEMDATKPKEDSLQSAPNDSTAQSGGGQSVEDFSASADMGDSAPEEKYSNLTEFRNDMAPTNGLPDASFLEVRVADSSSGKNLSNEQSRTSVPRPESLIQKAQPNPYRSIGDALDGWKERVKVSVDLEEQVENPNDMVEDADEYGYTAEFKEGTAQALGPATADQVKGDITQNDEEMDVENTESRDPTADIEIEKSTSETNPIVNSALNPVKDVNKQKGISDTEEQPGEAMEIDGDHNQDTTVESLVSVKRAYFSEDVRQIAASSSVNDDHLGKACDFEPSTVTRDDAAALWRRYEMQTTRLSQELAEQLRLVMEPTLASKLQGDYKTGKRINMKKVIPYIASHYRKDRIWLRRTRPSKRDYQVVIAVDDSRSMSEGQCGNFAMEALVTVCRAMSQLEVGNLAVASFGQQGNIRLLHDFDKPFTPDAGTKMISSLTFKQENTITDEPMVDLLKYLNCMLDDAVMRSRTPSGFNPLQQLVLIIADGRFNEKEKLKRRVRDILSTKRMVAFLLLDSPNESIMDFMEATVQGSEIKFSKYLDSFPFPYYVVLKNIEALPRTLADLLRQWFELMQYSRD